MSSYTGDISHTVYDDRPEYDAYYNQNVNDVSGYDDMKVNMNKDESVPFLRSIRTARTSMTSPDTAHKIILRTEGVYDDKDPFKQKRDEVDTLYSEMYKSNTQKNREVPKITQSLTGRRARSTTYAGNSNNPHTAVSAQQKDPYAAAASNLNTSITLPPSNISFYHGPSGSHTSHIDYNVPLVQPYSTSSHSQLYSETSNVIQDHANHNITDARNSIYKAIDMNTTMEELLPTMPMVPEQQYLEEKRVLSSHIEEQRRENTGLVTQQRVLHQKMEYHENERNHLSHNYEEEVRVLREKVLEKDIETFLLQKQVSTVESDVVQYRIREQNDQNVQSVTLDRLQSDLVLLKNKNQKIELELSTLQTVYTECNGEKCKLESKTREQSYGIDSLQSQCDTLRREHKMTLEERNDQHGKVIMQQARVDELGRLSETRRINEDVSSMQHEKDQYITMLNMKLENMASLKKEIDILQREKSELRNNQEKEQLRHRELKQVSDLKVDNLASELHSLKQQGASNVAEMQMLKTDNEYKMNQIRTLQVELREEREHRQKEKEEVRSLDETVSKAFKAQLSDKQVQMDSLGLQVSTKEKQMDALKQQVSTKEDQVNTLKQQVEDKNTQINALKQQVKDKNTQIVELEQQIEDKGAKVASKENPTLIGGAADALLSFKNKFEDKTSHVGDLQAQMTRKDGKISALETQIDTMLHTLDSKLQAKDDTIAMLETKLVAKETIITEFESRFATTKGEHNYSVDYNVSTLESKISTLETQLDGKNSKISTLETRIQGKDDKIAMLEGAIRTKEDKLAALEAVTATKADKVSSLENKLLHYDMKLSAVESKGTSDASVLQDRLTHAEREIATKSKKINTLEHELVQKDEQLSTVESSHVKTVATLENQVRVKEDRVLHLENMLDHKDGQLRQQEAKSAAEKDNSTNLEHSVRNMTVENGKLQAKAQSLLLKYDEEKLSHAQQVQALQNSDMEVFSMNTKHTALQKEVAMLQGTLVEVREQQRRREDDLAAAMLRNESRGNNTKEFDLILQKMLNGLQQKDAQYSVEKQELRALLEREMDTRVQSAVVSTREAVRAEVERVLRSQYEAELDRAITSAREALQVVEKELDAVKSQLGDTQQELQKEQEAGAVLREQSISSHLVADDLRRVLAVSQHQKKEMERRVKSPETAIVLSPSKRMMPPLPVQTLPQPKLAVSPKHTYNNNIFSTPAPRTVSQTPKSSIATLRERRLQSQQILDQLDEALNE